MPQTKQQVIRYLNKKHKTGTVLVEGSQRFKVTSVKQAGDVMWETSLRKARTEMTIEQRQSRISMQEKRLRDSADRINAFNVRSLRVTDMLQEIELIEQACRGLRALVDTDVSDPEVKRASRPDASVKTVPKGEKMHTHKAIQLKTAVWSRCVNPVKCAENPRLQVAHGNIIYRAVCSCGAVRETEVNGGCVNYGPWIEAR